jgi:flagellum-specific peptidoglycan hydrolase FlgJ
MSRLKSLTIVVLVSVVIWLGSVCAAGPSGPLAPDEFFSWLAPVAQEIVPQYGLFTSVFLAQSALESGFGKSIPDLGYNLFGRKCSHNPCIQHWTNEERSGVMVKELHEFQYYEDLPPAIHDYCQKYFRKYDSGHPVFLIDTSSIEAFIDGITQAPRPYARYATDSRYKNKIMSIIIEYDLTKYD